MISNITYKLSCFADYAQLEYNKDDIINILNAFKDAILIPSVIPEFNQTGRKSQRMHFLTSDGLMEISIMSSRIDIQITSNDRKGFPQKAISEIKDKLNLFMNKLYDIFSRKISLPNRLAWFTTYVFFEVDESEKILFRNKFLKTLPFFEKNRLDDLLIRYGAQRQFSISGQEEDINVITTISPYYAFLGTELEVNGYGVDIDINTSQFNARNRFESNSIGLFCDNAINVQEELINEIFPV